MGGTIAVPSKPPAPSEHRPPHRSPDLEVPPKDHFPELQLLLVTALPEQTLEAGLTVKAHQVLREHVADVLRQPCNHRVVNGDASSLRSRASKWTRNRPLNALTPISTLPFDSCSCAVGRVEKHLLLQIQNRCQL